MIQTDHSAVSFDDADTRTEAMHRTVETWIENLESLVDDAAASEEFRAWLDVQSRFRNYSYRNTLLIKSQRPNATRVAGYRTWQTEFDRHVKKGETAIWIWAPIVASKCPRCGNSPSYHENSDCTYGETPPSEWSRGVVGFKPAAVFDISQTDGEPLPELETDAIGGPADFVETVLRAADELGVEAHVVPAVDWSYGTAKGVCLSTDSAESRPTVAAKAGENSADLAMTLVHEYAHALLHVGIDDDTERSKREVEAEAVAYVVGRYFGLDTSRSAFYLAAWQDEDSEALRNRLGRINRTATTIIDAVEP